MLDSLTALLEKVIEVGGHQPMLPIINSTEFENRPVRPELRAAVDSKSIPECEEDLTAAVLGLQRPHLVVQVAVAVQEVCWSAQIGSNLLDKCWKEREPCPRRDSGTAEEDEPLLLLCLDYLGWDIRSSSNDLHVRLSLRLGSTPFEHVLQASAVRIRDSCVVASLVHVGVQ